MSTSRAAICIHALDVHLSTMSNPAAVLDTEQEYYKYRDKHGKWYWRCTRSAACWKHNFTTLFSFQRHREKKCTLIDPSFVPSIPNGAVKRSCPRAEHPALHVGQDAGSPCPQTPQPAAEPSHRHSHNEAAPTGDADAPPADHAVQPQSPGLDFTGPDQSAASPAATEVEQVHEHTGPEHADDSDHSDEDSVGGSSLPDAFGMSLQCTTDHKAKLLEHRIPSIGLEHAISRNRLILDMGCCRVVVARRRPAPRGGCASGR